MKPIKSAGLLVFSLPLTFALVSAAYQARGVRRDRARYLPPGRVIQSGGRRVHVLAAAGPGLPVIVITGGGSPCLEWVAVQRALAGEVRVVLYDRAGLGWSDAAAGPRSAGRMARELHELLATAGITPPVILAGHSIGGLAALIYAGTYPGEVAGLALIDSSHPDMLTISWPDRRARWLISSARALARPLGLIRMACDLGLRDSIDSQAALIYPADLAGAGKALLLSSQRRRTGVRELLAVPRSCREAAPHLHHLGRLPLAVTTAGEPSSGTPGSRSAARAHHWYLAWQRMQADLAALSSDSTHDVATAAGHYIHRQDPALIAGVLRDLAHRTARQHK